MTRVLSNLLPFLVVLGCAAAPAPASPVPPCASGEVGSAPSAGPVAQAKYVFLFIGDGMGLAQVRAAELFAAGTPEADALGFTRFPAVGLATTHADGAAITDSAAAATALASGHKTASGVLGLLADRTSPVVSVAQVAKQRGMRVGILTSVSLDHATPAAFYAHASARGSYHAISLQLVASGFDLFAGGGFKEPVPLAEPAAVPIWDLLRARGFTVARTHAEQDAVRALPAVVVDPELDSEAALPYAIDRAPSGRGLHDYTRQAIELLESPAGFFLMVEGGKIDWACHANDAATAIWETLELGRAVEVAFEFLGRHPTDTLIVVTADHETGGLAFAGVTGTDDLDLRVLARQRLSQQRLGERLAAEVGARPRVSLEDLAPLIERDLGLQVGPVPSTSSAVSALRVTSAEAAVLRAALEELKGRGAVQAGASPRLAAGLVQLLGARAGLTWVSQGHTGQPVPVFAAGAGHPQFDAYLDNTEIGQRLLEVVAGEKPSAPSLP